MARPLQRIALDTLAVGPALVMGLLVALAILLFITGRSHPYDISVCLTKAGYPPPQPPSQPSWWSGAFLTIVVLAFGVGHLTSYLRRWVEGHRPVPELTRVGGRIFQVMVILFLAFGVLLTAYETVSVVPDRSTPAAWPISYYVRCVNDAAPLPTLLGTAVVAFLLGHWLCHPARPRRERGT